MHERRLSRPALADDGDRFALADVEVYTAKRIEARLSGAIVFGYRAVGTEEGMPLVSQFWLCPASAFRYEAGTLTVCMWRG